MKHLLRHPFLTAIVLLCILLFGFTLWNPGGVILTVIQSTGWFGAVGVVLIMIVVSMVPCPPELLLLTSIELYGVAEGVTLSVVGSIIGSAITWFLIRRFAFDRFQGSLKSRAWKRIERRTASGGVTGLLIVRILPVPTSLINYAASMNRHIRFIDYLWTNILVTLCYYTVLGLSYDGLLQQADLYIAILGILIIAIALIVRWRRKSRSGYSGDAHPGDSPSAIAPPQPLSPCDARE